MSLKEQSISLSLRLLKPNVLPNDALRKSHALKPIPSELAFCTPSKALPRHPLGLASSRDLHRHRLAGL